MSALRPRGTGSGPQAPGRGTASRPMPAAGATSPRPLPELPRRSDFPAGFVFGTATSAYQIEGQSFGGAGPTHWDALARRPGAIADETDGAVACDHYHRYEQDLDLAAAFDAYRFSVNWARVQPLGRGPVNPEGLDFYDRLSDAILARGLQPHLTLYHWELPQALAEAGGWQSRDTAARFGDFAELILRRIGDRMASVATVNEPACVAWVGHFEGSHAPGLKSLPAAARAMHHVLLGHAEALERGRALGRRDLGIVLNFEAIAAVSGSDADRDAADRRDAIMNRWHVEAIARARYPDAALAGLGAHLPEGWQDDMARIAAPLDWLGVNYYTRARVAADPQARWPKLRLQAGARDKTAMGWEIYPEGLYDVLMRLRRDWTGDLPLRITENGAAFADRLQDGAVRDPARCAFFAAHLRQVLRAIDDGVNVGAYFAWSLLDNFEWAWGQEKRFGLVHVDFSSQKRTPKQSYHLLRQALA